MSYVSISLRTTHSMVLSNCTRSFGYGTLLLSLWPKNIPSCVCAIFPLSIHLVVDTYLPSSKPWLLRTLQRWTWMCRCLSRVPPWESCGYITGNGAAGSYGTSISSFLRSFNIHFHGACTGLYPHQYCVCFLMLSCPSALKCILYPIRRVLLILLMFQ